MAFGGSKPTEASGASVSLIIQPGQTRSEEIVYPTFWKQTAEELSLKRSIILIATRRPIEGIDANATPTDANVPCPGPHQSSTRDVIQQGFQTTVALS